MDQTVTLSEREWQQVVNAIANQPWHLANPLLMRIGEQLRQQGLPPSERKDMHWDVDKKQYVDGAPKPS